MLALVALSPAAALAQDGENSAPFCISNEGSEPEVMRDSQDQRLWLPCYDPDGDPLEINTIVSGSTNGTLGPVGSYDYGDGDVSYYVDYTPTPGYTGEASFTLNASDGQASSDTVTFGIVVVPPSPPTCEQPPQLDVRTNSDGRYVDFWCWGNEEHGELTYTVTDRPDHGSLEIPEWSDGSTAFYTPHTGYDGLDSFSYTASNDAGDAEQVVTQTINVDPAVNGLPQCMPDEQEMRANSTKQIELSCYDPDGDDITYSIVAGQGPSDGTLGPIATNSTGASVDYTPNADFVGTDSFQYRASDSFGGGQAATIDIVVHPASWNTPPECWEETAPEEVEAGDSAYISPDCWDAQDDPISYAVKTDPQRGQVTQHTATEDGETYFWFEYVPNAGYEGLDSFTYTASDGQGGSTDVVVPLSVIPPQPPECWPQEAINLRTAQDKSIWLSCWGSDAGGPLTIEITQKPANGSLRFAWEDGDPMVVYRSNAGFNGTDVFKYRAVNSVGRSAEITQTLHVSPSHNSAPMCWEEDDWATIVRSGSSAELHLDCWDADGDRLTYSVGSGPAKGSLGTFAQPEFAHEPGRVAYTANSGATGQDSFTYTANDGHGGTSSSVTRRLDIKPADYNSAPECWAGPIQLRVAQNASLPLSEDQAPCYDAEGDKLSFDITDPPDKGTLSAPDSHGVRTYTPNSGITGKDGFSFRANDSRTLSPQTVVVEITITEPSKITVPQAPTRPSGGAVTVQNYVDESTGQSFVTVPNSQASEFPNGCMPLTMTVEINPGTGEISNQKLVLETDGGRRTSDLTGGNPGAKSSWSATITCAATGDLFVEYDLTEDGTTIPVRIPIGGLVLIDPQGVVHDKAQYDAAIASGKTPEEARSAAAITGATVRLQRRVNGQWANVLSGDPGIAPNVNPQVTGSNGLYQWDVAAGVYRVVVTKDGYHSVTSDAVVIPPPVLDLHIPMTRVAPTPDPTPTTGGNDGSTGSSGDSGTPKAGTTPGSGSPGANPPANPPTGGSSPTPKPACFGLSGQKRAKCQAGERLKKALAKCAKARGKKGKACAKRAKAQYKRDVKLAKCVGMKPKKKKLACQKKAKGGKKK